MSNNTQLAVGSVEWGIPPSLQGVAAGDQANS